MQEQAGIVSEGISFCRKSFVPHDPHAVDHQLGGGPHPHPVPVPDPGGQWRQPAAERRQHPVRALNAPAPLMKCNSLARRTGDGLSSGGFGTSAMRLQTALTLVFLDMLSRQTMSRGTDKFNNF